MEQKKNDISGEKVQNYDKKVIASLIFLEFPKMMGKALRQKTLILITKSSKFVGSQ